MRTDLNADLGESFGRWQLGDDAALLPVITSANVACGFHAGDPLTLRRTCAAAAAAGVVIGAQVGYRDLAGFGRRFIDVAPDDLTAEVLYQLGALQAMAHAAGSSVRYLKPHGALYHATVDSPDQAGAVVSAVLAFDPGLALLGFPGSELLRIGAEHGLRTVTEYFVDRRYGADGRLVDRRQPDALLTDPDEAAERALEAASGGAGEEVPESFCVHGDTPGAVAFASAVRARLVDAGVTVAAFAG